MASGRMGENAQSPESSQPHVAHLSLLLQQTLHSLSQTSQPRGRSSLGMALLRSMKLYVKDDLDFLDERLQSINV